MRTEEGNTADLGDDFWGFVESLWMARNVILLCTAVGAVASVSYALLAKEIYRSEALVQARQETRASGGLGAFASQLGGLAGLTGLSLPGGGERAVAVATLSSRTVIEPFIQERNLLPKLFKSKWDPANSSWRGGGEPPSLWDGHDVFLKDNLRIVEDKKTGLYTVAVEWEDPEEAQRWVTELIERTNEHLKAKEIAEGERNLAYLEQQSRKIGQVELQQSLYGLVESELKRLMVAKGGEEFAIRTIDRAAVPKKRVRPKRMLIALIGTMLGAIAGVAAALAMASWRTRSAARAAFP